LVLPHVHESVKKFHIYSDNLIVLAFFLVSLKYTFAK
jgi:hypothetical protein